MAVDLITERKLGLPGQRCVGAMWLNRTSGEVDTYHARFVILATGGAATGSSGRQRRLIQLNHKLRNKSF